MANIIIDNLNYTWKYTRLDYDNLALDIMEIKQVFTKN